MVIGQSGFDQLDPVGDPETVMTPMGRPAVTLDGQLLVAGIGSSILIFGNYGATNGPVADAVFSVREQGDAYDLSIGGAKLVVSSLFKVSILNSIPTANVDPDAFAGNGLPGCSASQLEQFTAAVLTRDGSRLIVADTNNNRVLIWNDVDQATGSLGDADIVLGQPGPLTCEPNAGGNPGSATMDHPGSVWSDGDMLIVADTGNNRLLIWNDIDSIVSFQEADVVIGQENDSVNAPNRGQSAPSSISLSQPQAVDVSAQGELAVTDTGNNRVLVWRTIPTGADQQADFVVGQSDFTHGAANDPGQTGLHGTTLSAKTLFAPQGARFHGRNLIVNDTSNHRVLVWRESD